MSLYLSSNTPGLCYAYPVCGGVVNSRTQDKSDFECLMPIDTSTSVQVVVLILCNHKYLHAIACTSKEDSSRHETTRSINKRGDIPAVTVAMFPGTLLKLVKVVAWEVTLT